jgi:hypothetical protein
MQCVLAVQPSVPFLAILYFSTLSHERHNFRKKIIGYKMCLVLSTRLSEKIILGVTE